MGENKEPKTFTGDLLVAADGSMSQVRAKFRPQDKRRYRNGRVICVHVQYNARVRHAGQLSDLTVATVSPTSLQMRFFMSRGIWTGEGNGEGAGGGHLLQCSIDRLHVSIAGTQATLHGGV